MPVQPDIALGVKPIELPNPLIMALHGAVLRNQTMQGNALQQGILANQATSEAVKAATDPNTGAVDYDKAMTGMANDPRAAFNLPQFAQSVNTMKAQQIGIDKAKLDLANQQLGTLTQQVTKLVNKPDLTHEDVWGEIALTAKNFKLPGAVIAQMVSDVPEDPKQLKPFLQQFLISIQDKATQLQAQTPNVTFVNNGQQQTPVNVNPNAGPIAPVGAPIQNKVAPGNLETIEQDAVGNKHVVSRTPEGAIVSTRPVPGSGTPAASSGNGPRAGTGWTNLTPGQAADINAAQQEVQSIRSVGDQAPTQRNINQKILQLSKVADSGPGTQKWQNAMGAVSSLWGGTAQVNNYQELGKFLEKNAITNMQAMGGPPSDARLSAAMAANGSTQFNAGALQAVTKFNDATTTAMDKYRQGVDKAVGLKNSDYTALPTFKAAWAKNMDVDIFRVENAIRDGDKAELQKIAQELGPQRMKELAQKRLNLEALSKTGKLP